VKAEPDAVAAAWPELFHRIRRQPFDAAEHAALVARYLEPRKIALPDRELQTRRGVTVRSRGVSDGPPAVEHFPKLAPVVWRHNAAGDDEAVLFHLRCLAQWQTRYQPRGVVAPSIVGGAAASGEDDVMEAFDLTGEDEEQTAEIDVERWIAECWVERVVKAEPGATVGGGAAARPAVVVKAEPVVAVEAVEAVEEQEEEEQKWTQKTKSPLLSPTLSASPGSGRGRLPGESHLVRENSTQDTPPRAPVLPAKDITLQLLAMPSFKKRPIKVIKCIINRKNVGSWVVGSWVAPRYKVWQYKVRYEGLAKEDDEWVDADRVTVEQIEKFKPKRKNRSRKAAKAAVIPPPLPTRRSLPVKVKEEVAPDSVALGSPPRHDPDAGATMRPEAAKAEYITGRRMELERMGVAADHVATAMEALGQLTMAEIESSVGSAWSSVEFQPWSSVGKPDLSRKARGRSPSAERRGHLRGHLYGEIYRSLYGYQIRMLQDKCGMTQGTTATIVGSNRTQWKLENGRTVQKNGIGTAWELTAAATAAAAAAAAAAASHGGTRRRAERSRQLSSRRASRSPPRARSRSRDQSRKRSRSRERLAVVGVTACKWAGRCNNDACIFSHTGDGEKILRARPWSPPLMWASPEWASSPESRGTSPEWVESLDEEPDEEAARGGGRTELLEFLRHTRAARKEEIVAVIKARLRKALADKRIAREQVRRSQVAAQKG
jgi:hypothetical protein